MNKAKLSTYKIILEVKSPLFIGSGKKYNRMDYIHVTDHRKMYVLQEDKWIDFLIRKNATNSYIQYISRNSNRIDLYQFIHNHQRILGNISLDTLLPIISSHSFSTEQLDVRSNHDIYAFMKRADGLPFIPGSSIKGAISTAISKSLIAQSHERSQSIEKAITQYEANDEQLHKSIEEQHKQTMNLLDFKSPYDNSKTLKGMSGIQISDSTPFSLNQLKLYQKIDIAPNSTTDYNPKQKSNKIPMYRECANIGTKVEFTLSIDMLKINPVFGITKVEDIFQIIKESFDTIYGTLGVLSVYEGIKQYLPEFTDQSECYIQLGGGAGFHSKTIISGIRASAHTRNVLTARILSINKKFKMHKHDRVMKVISPRCIKVTKVNQKHLLMGICKISVR